MSEQTMNFRAVLRNKDFFAYHGATHSGIHPRAAFASIYTHSQSNISFHSVYSTPRFSFLRLHSSPPTVRI